jgi:hypothetical protein
MQHQMDVVLQNNEQYIFFVTGASIHYTGSPGTNWDATKLDTVNLRAFSKIKYFG